MGSHTHDRGFKPHRGIYLYVFRFLWFLLLCAVSRVLMVLDYFHWVVVAVVVVFVVVVDWGTWSFGMYDHGLRFLLTFMPTLLTLCRSFARTYRGSGSLSTLPWTPHQLTAEVYPHRVSTSVSAWDYLASTHANTSAVKHSGPASLPRKSQAARNGAILLGQAAATFLQQYWVLAFCLCIHKQCEHICMYTQPVHTSSSVYTHMSTYIVYM